MNKMLYMHFNKLIVFKLNHAIFCNVNESNDHLNREKVTGAAEPTENQLSSLHGILETIV